MATRADTVAHVLEVMAGAGDVSARKMFGEYAVYLDAKVVALICDDTVFLKPLAVARAMLPDAEEAPPYSGAKPHLVLDAALDDPDLVARLLRAVADALPPPKPNKRT
ncbi:MAG: TfoX/Sxy family protein [Paracoccaceae bacterium]